MLETIEKIDQELFLYLNQFHTPWLDTVMWYISSTVLWIPLFLFFIYYAWRKGQWQFALVALIGCALCVVFADQISVNLFKNVFERYRPTHHSEIGPLVKTVTHNGNEYRGGLYGFVSSHAANYFALGTYLFLLFKRFSKIWYLLFFWALLIGYSRIYLGVHYPLDVIGGGILGVLIGFGIYKLAWSIYLKSNYL